MKETEKVDQTIRAISDEIQARINAGDTDSVAKLTKALAALITAKANLNMSVRMHEGKKANQYHQK